MIGEKRSSLEILQEIIRLAGQGQKKTRIMYGANLSYDMLNKYLEFLLVKGFVTVDPTTNRYGVTPAGHEFLRDLDKVTRHFRAADELVVLK